MRRIMKFQPGEINKSNIKYLGSEVSKGIENLRSGVAKIALMTVVEMSELFEKLLDSEVDGLFRALLKKSVDSNSFIAEEVGRAVYQLSRNCSEGKVLILVQ